MIISANRALGLLHNFIVQEYSHITEWYVPATICYSVPFLFRKLNKNIVFYDFGFDRNLITTQLNVNDGPRGLLLYDYYGKSWENEDILALEQQFDCLILDSCLSRPQFTDAGRAIGNMQLFSTGDKKYTNLGYGGYALVPKAVTLSFSAPAAQKTIEENDHHLETLWKNCSDKASFQNMAGSIGSNWIDTAADKITPAYITQVQESTEKATAHKMRINDVYKNTVPEDLWMGNEWNDWRFNIITSNQDLLMNELFKNGFFASKHYKNMAPYFGASSLPNSAFIENHIINLFNDDYITEDRAYGIAMLIKNAYRNSLIQPVNNKILS